MPGTPPTTPIHGIPRIATTDTDDVPRDLNAAVDALDATAVAYSSGLAAARPATGVNNRWYYATDTRQWSRYTTGGGWETPAPSAHAATHQDGGTDPLTVREAMMATGALGLAKGAFYAYRNAAVSTAGTAAFAVVFDSELYDVSAWHNIATGVFTPLLAGYYRLSWGVSIGTAIAMSAMATLQKNSVDYAKGSHSQGSSFAAPMSTGAVNVLANGTTDAFRIVVTNNSGAVALGTGASVNYFCGEFIGRS